MRRIFFLPPPRFPPRTEESTKGGPGKVRFAVSLLHITTPSIPFYDVHHNAQAINSCTMLLISMLDVGYYNNVGHAHSHHTLVCRSPLGHINLITRFSSPPAPTIECWSAYFDAVKITCANRKRSCQKRISRSQTLSAERMRLRERWYLLSAKYASPHVLISCRRIFSWKAAAGHPL